VLVVAANDREKEKEGGRERETDRLLERQLILLFFSRFFSFLPHINDEWKRKKKGRRDYIVA
jgi:hypothetical protein